MEDQDRHQALLHSVGYDLVVLLVAAAARILRQHLDPHERQSGRIDVVEQGGPKEEVHINHIIIIKSRAADTLREWVQVRDRVSAVRNHELLVDSSHLPQERGHLGWLS